MRALKPYVILTLVAAVAGLAAAGLLLERPGLDLQAGSALETPRPIGQFELADQHEQPFTQESLHGNWNLLFIGFTNCPDVCPTTLAILAQVEAGLGAKGDALTPVFVSVDPERDTPDVLGRYVGLFGGKILGVTGSPKQLGRLCSDLNFAYVKIPQGGGDYTVDHSGAVALVDPQARVVGYFTPPFETARLVADLAGVL